MLPLALPLRAVVVSTTVALALAACGVTTSAQRTAGHGSAAGSLQTLGSTGHPQLRPPASSAPAAPALSPAIRPGVFALGDSVMLGAKPALTTQRYRVDAKVGRQFFEGIVELRAINRTGALPRNVVVHLGTNGTITSKHCDSMVATAGPSRRVFFVTVFGPRSWMRPNDVVLRACAARHPANVVLIDWATAVAQHPRWLGHDRIHPNTVGHKAYTSLIESTVRRYRV